MPRRAWCLVVCMLPVFACADTLRVEIRNSEVWLLRDGRPRQLTRDGKSKAQVLLSPAPGRIAYYQQCPPAERCTPAVVIVDLTGRRLSSFRPGSDQLGNDPPGNPACGNLWLVEWAGDRTVASQCHINPSLEEYFESDVASGRTTRDLLGYGFTRSPNGKQVAHAGWIVHFAPPYAHSNYLQFDHTTVYPLPPGTKPAAENSGESPPGVVHQQGSTYSGIHEFLPGFFWAPDSRHVAFIDCIYTWTANRPQSQAAADGEESDRHCSVVVVSPAGRFNQLPLTVSPNLAKLSWTSAHELSVQTNGLTRTIRLR
jgi:hypothetical protein